MATSKDQLFSDFQSAPCEEAVQKAAAGDETAFAYLAELFQPLITSIISCYNLPDADAHDLSQEGLIALYKAVLLYDSKLASFSTFATVCIRSGILDALRKVQKDRRFMPVDFSDETVSADTILSPERIFLGKEALSGLLSKLDKALSPMERKVLGLHLAGKKNPAIAEILGKDPKSVENTLFRLRKKLSGLA